MFVLQKSYFITYSVRYREMTFLSFTNIIYKHVYIHLQFKWLTKNILIIFI
nr:MAG TPA: hypothetical protein [Caudoviricetes sp.]